MVTSSTLQAMLTVPLVHTLIFVTTLSAFRNLWQSFSTLWFLHAHYKSMDWANSCLRYCQTWIFRKSTYKSKHQLQSTLVQNNYWQIRRKRTFFSSKYGIIFFYLVLMVDCSVYMETPPQSNKPDFQSKKPWSLCWSVCKTVYHFGWTFRTVHRETRRGFVSDNQ